MANEVFPALTVESRVVHGRPVIAGTRIPVEVVVGELAGGSSFEDIMADYHLTIEQIRAALGYAALGYAALGYAALGYAAQMRSSTTVYVAS